MRDVPTVGITRYNGNMEWIRLFFLYTSPLWLMLASIAGVLLLIKVVVILAEGHRNWSP